MDREKYERLDKERRIKYALKEGSFWLVASVVSFSLFAVVCLREYSHERVLMRALNGTLGVSAVGHDNFTETQAAVREQMEAAMQIVNEEKNALSAELGRLVMELDSTKSSLEAKEGTGEASMLKAQIMEQQKMFSKDLAHIHSLAQTQKAAEQKARTKVLKLSADADRYKSKLAAQRLQTATYNKKLKNVGVKVRPGGEVEVVAVDKFLKGVKQRGHTPPVETIKDPTAMQTITRRRRVPKTGRRLLESPVTVVQATVTDT